MISDCKKMDSEIIDFIKGNKIAVICCSDSSNMPYCFHCFYAFDEKKYLLFFKSSSQTFHSKLLLENPYIAGSILPGKIELLALKGVQLAGTILYNEIPDHIEPSAYYHKRFPLALAKRGVVWFIQLELVKMTDNTNVFGKKSTWNKRELV